MRKLKILFLSLFLTGSSAEAQFLKKLKKKVEDKVEQKMINNVADKAAMETENSLNKMWETDPGNLSMGGERVDPAEVPARYSFDWEYSLKIKSGEGDMEMTYLLKEDASHFGMKLPNLPDTFMVMDGFKKLMVMFMNSEGNKMFTATRIDPQHLKDPELENSYPEAQIIEIAPKTIMGYTCKGYQTETPEYVTTFYITREAGLSFSDMFKVDQKNVPNGFDPSWLEDEGIMMEMNLEDKKNAAKNVSITCNRLVKKEFTISKTDYQAF